MIDQRHQHADPDAEAQRQNDTRDGEVGTERNAGVGQREDVGRRGEEQ